MALHYILNKGDGQEAVIVANEREGVEQHAKVAANRFAALYRVGVVHTRDGERKEHWEHHCVGHWHEIERWKLAPKLTDLAATIEPHPKRMAEQFLPSVPRTDSPPRVTRPQEAPTRDTDSVCDTKTSGCDATGVITSAGDPQFTTTPARGPEEAGTSPPPLRKGHGLCPFGCGNAIHNYVCEPARDSSEAPLQRMKPADAHDASGR